MSLDIDCRVATYVDWTVWKFQHFSVTQILREINLEILKVQTMPFLPIKPSEFDFT